MPLRSLIGVFLGSLVAPLFAAPPDLTFRPTGLGLYEFNTGPLRGGLKVDGKYQGLYPVVDTATGAELVHAPGVFSLYRVFSTGRRYGDAARDWPTATRLLDDGGVEVLWPPAAEHPVEMAAIYRWKGEDALDFDVKVAVQQAMPKFELFLSSYFTKGFRAAVYRSVPGEGEKRFVPVDRTPQSTGGYVMFPRDEDAEKLILDGRWKIPPSPVDWAIERHLAAPLVIRRDEKLGLCAVIMSQPKECFAVSCPWNPATPEGGGYRSVYLSLFGRDLEAGQTAHARCRLILGRNLSEAEAVRRYEEFLQEAK